METMNEQMNVTNKSMIVINDLCFGDVTMNVTDYGIVNIYNSTGWICGIDLEDIKTFTSNNSEIDSEVNKFILEQISK